MIRLILFFFFKKNSQSKFPITRNRPITRPLSRLNYPWRGKEACGYKNIGSVRGNTGSLYASEWLICRAIFSQLESMSNRAITIHHLRAKYPRFIFSLFIHRCYSLLATFARNWDCGFFFMETDLLILLSLLIKRLRV